MPTIRKIPRPTEGVSPPAGLSLTRDDIAAWVGEQSLARGRPYAADSIFDARRTGRMLKARCQGTAAQPYRVTAMLDERGGVAASDCSCPLGDRCKHVAALLLAWLADPDAFVEVEDAEAALVRRDKPELIALIRLMLARSPELETLLELPLPAAGRAAPPVDAVRIRREVVAAFRNAGDDWRAAIAVADALEPLVQLGDEYAATGDWRGAATIYGTIAQGVTDEYGSQEDEGELAAVVDRCVDGLAKCLSETSDLAQRESLLRALFDIYRWDVEYGGVGMGEEAPDVILEHATPAERRLVSTWVREALAGAAGSDSSWRREHFGGFLLRLAGDELDDEAFLQICRETGRQRDLVERLLALGRTDAAVAEVNRADDGALLGLADMLCTHGLSERAVQLVRERNAAPVVRGRFSEWLRDRAREAGDLADAQGLTEALFWQQPTLARYNELRTLAEERGTWAALRPELLRQLDRKGQHALLTEIYLQDGEVPEALGTIGKASGGYGYGYGGEPLPIRVAKAAEDQHPRDAIALYQAAATQLVRGQGRENYALAARYLARVRGLYQRLGDNAAWNALIAAIRNDNKRLRALREELDRVAL